MKRENIENELESNM